MIVLISQCFPQDESRGWGSDGVMLRMKLLLAELVLWKGRALQERHSVWWDLVSCVEPEQLRVKQQGVSVSRGNTYT